MYGHPLVGVLPKQVDEGLDLSLLLAGLFAIAGGGTALPFRPTTGRVQSFQKISSTVGGLTGGLENDGFFGRGATAIGDVDHDGIVDLAVSAWADDDGGLDIGAVWVLLMNRDGTVRSQQTISAAPSGGFTGTLLGGDYFGYQVGALGDLDGDGVPDLAVGAVKANDGGTWRGANWLLFLNGDGTVKNLQKISSTSGGFAGPLADQDFFSTPAGIGDLNGDGVRDLIAGAAGDDTADTESGAVWVLFLNANGTVNSQQKIAGGVGGFTGIFGKNDAFGESTTAIGDLDADGVVDVAVGVPFDDAGGANRGAVYILFLNSNGTVKSSQKISSTEGGFTGPLQDDDNFGFVSGPGDLNGDGVPDLIVGAGGDDDGGTDRGAVWVLFLNSNGTVKAHQKISALAGNFTGQLDDSDGFGVSPATPGDLNGDGVPDLVVGASFDDDGGTNPGAAWVLFLEPAQ